MGTSLGFVVEGLVAVLLMVTIGYCVLVNRKLEQLRSDQSELRQIIRELNAATGQAETAITVLRQSAQSAETTLRATADEADNLAACLADEMAKAETLMSKLTMLTRACAQRPAPAPAPAPVSQAAPRSELRASAIGIGLLNAQRRSADGDGRVRGAA
jgi:septal ring factor EnvC (AmiA/AmiB activator)